MDQHDPFDDNLLSREDYAAQFLDPDRAELDLWMRDTFRDLGWATVHRDSGGYGELWHYPGSFGGRDVNQIDALYAGGIEPLEAGVTAGPMPIVHVHTCGVHNGCPAHGSVDHQLPRDSPELPGLLSALQQHADAIDTAALAQCWVFGPCGRTGSERPW